MNPFKAVRLGLGRAKRRKRAVLLYWLFHTAMALTVALPLAGTGIAMVAKTKYGDELLHDFDLMFLAEAVYQAGSTAWALCVLTAAILPLYIGTIYLSGGALNVLRRSDEFYSPALFWDGAGRYFWRFLRVSLYSLIAWIPFAIARGGLGLAIRKIWGEGMEGGPGYFWTQVQTVVSLLLAAYAITVVDYTRARLAAQGSRQAFKTLLQTMRWVVRNPVLTFGPWALLALAFAFATALYLKVASWIPATITPLAIVLIVVQQAYVLFRVFVRFVGWGAVIEIDSAARGDNESHEPEQEVFSYVDNGGDGSLRAGAAVDPEAESPEAG
jgi:hypothetical protein